MAYWDTEIEQCHCNLFSFICAIPAVTSESVSFENSEFSTFLFRIKQHVRNLKQSSSRIEHQIAGERLSGLHISFKACSIHRLDSFTGVTKLLNILKILLFWKGTLYAMYKAGASSR